MLSKHRYVVAIGMIAGLTLSLGTWSGCGDDDGCSDECQGEFTTQCDGQVIQTCRRSSSGCLAWTATTDCGLQSLYCHDETGTAQCTDQCVDLCDTVNSTQCDGSLAQRCEMGTAGCLEWVTIEDCAPAGDTCEMGTNGAECVQDCSTTPPDAPANPTPADNATGVDSSTVSALDWDDANGATRYEVYFGECPAPDWPAVSYVAASSSERTGITVEGATDYCWRVVAFNAEGCRTEGPEWTFSTLCADPVAGAPTVTSGDSNLSPTTSGTYRLTFSEAVVNVDTSLTWAATTGSGVMDSVTQVDASTYDVAFSGVAPGDAYTLTVGTGVEDTCGNALAAAVTIHLTVDEQHGDTCSDPQNITNASFPYGMVGTFDTDSTGGSCDTDGTNMVFYRYTPSSTGLHRIYATNASTTYAYSRIAVFEGLGCAPYGTEVDCITNSDTEATLVTDLTASTDYLIIFYTDGDSYTMESPTITVENMANTPGIVCSQAADVTSQTFPYQLTGTFDIDGDGGTCDTEANNSVFFTYTPASSGFYQIDLLNNTTTYAYSRLAVYQTANCNPFGTEVSCESNSAQDISSVVDLTGGTTYLIQYYTDGDSYTTVNPEITIAPFTYDPGEVCTEAVDVTSQTFPYQLTGTFDYDPTELGTCTEGTGANAVYYTYSPATTGTYEINLVNNTTSTSAHSYVTIYQGTNCSALNNEAHCQQADEASLDAVVSLNSANDYTIVFHTQGDSYTMVDPEISVSTYTPVDGDTCDQPYSLASASFPYTRTGSFRREGTGGTCDPAGNNMVWFTYSPATTGWYSITGTNGASGTVSSRLAVFEGTGCAPLGAQYDCQTSTTNTASSVLHLDQTQTYSIAFYTGANGEEMLDPQINIQSATAPPAGQFCDNPVALSLGSMPHSETGTFDTDAPGGSCDEEATNAIFYTFAPSSSGTYQITATNATTTNAYSRLSIFDTTDCHPYGTEVACNSASAKTVDVTTPLDAGHTYLLMFYTDGDSYTMVDPEINITTVTPNAGESCSTAVAVSSFPHNLTGTFDLDPPKLGSCVGSAGYNAVYYTYTPSTSHWYSVALTNNTTVTGANAAVTIYDTAACAPTGAEISCKKMSDKDITSISYLEAGHTYLIVFHTTNGDTYTMVNPSIDIQSSAAPPPGLTCTNPADTSSSNHYIGSSGGDCWQWSADTSDMTSDHTYSCDSITGGDVVIAYTTGASQTTLLVDAEITNTDTDGYIGFEITDAPCASGASLDCQSSSGVTAHNKTYTVTPNTTYYLWVGDGYYDNYLPDIDICVR